MLFRPKAPPEKTEVPEVQGDDEFLPLLRGVAFSAGYDNDEDIEKVLLVNFPRVKTINNIPADAQSLIIDFFNDLRDKKEE